MVIAKGDSAPEGMYTREEAGGKPRGSGGVCWEARGGRHGQASFLSYSPSVSSARPFWPPGEFAELAPKAQEGKDEQPFSDNLTLPQASLFCYKEKFKLFFAALKTASCDDLASRCKFAEGPRKRRNTKKTLMKALTPPTVLRYNLWWALPLTQACGTYRET